MDDLEKYIDKRKKKSKYLVENFEDRYETFKIGILLKKAREEVGLTQDEIAKKLKTKKSAISRIENHSEDIRLSTLKNYVEALGKKLQLVIN
ncbi:MAG: helix-turn-helix transcriptional regulator [Calditrichia bacterium]|jgi:DNA-binding XRE family transcriptional regulator|nr:helix-turn-helix transcriptional regulator [Calditrichia bacterium]